MKRKLIKQGLGGYTVTVPVNWIREYNLDAGNEVNVTEVEGGLMITGELSKRERKIEIVVLQSFTKRMIHNLIYQAYRLGYDVIKIKFEKESQLNFVKSVVNYLIGFEIVKNGKDFCVLENIAEPDVEKFEVMLRKLFLQILELTETVYSDVNSEIFNDLNETKLLIDRLTNYIRRTIIRAKYGAEKSSLLYAIASKLSLICHEYYYLYEYLSNKNLKVSKSVLKMLNDTNILFRKFYDAFYKKDYKVLFEIGEEKLKLFSLNDSLLEKSKGIDNVVLANIREIIRLTQMCATFTIGYRL